MSLGAEKRRKAKALEEAGAALSVKLSARSTRGQRISELQGDDAEADETFWGQGAWQEEEEGDSEFSSEEEEPDKFDKDFNDSESEEDEDDDKEETTLRRKERAAKRKRPAGGVYKEPKRSVTLKRKSVTQQGGSSSSCTPASGVNVTGASGGGGERGSGASGESGVPIKRSVRASTQNKTRKSFKVREGEAKAREAQLKRSTQQQKSLTGQFTQKQLLLEAIQTEQENMRWILKQQRLEDEAKEDEGRPKQHKALASRYVSRRGCMDTIFFPDVYHLPPILCQGSADAGHGAGSGLADDGRPVERLCKITGVPAKYKDPLSGHYYADSNAFREVRKRYGPAARRRLKDQQQELDAKEASSSGSTTQGPAVVVAGNRSENGVAAGAGAGAAASAGGTAGSTAVAATAAVGASGNGSPKGVGSSNQAGEQASGHAKKQGSSKEGDKKPKSSAGKGKGKAKAAKSATPPKAEGSTASRTAADETGPERQEKPKAGTKRPRTKDGGAKNAKPVKRPFFAPPPDAIAPATNSVDGHEAGLVPLKGNRSVVAVDQICAPRSDSAVVGSTLGKFSAPVAQTSAAMQTPSGESSHANRLHSATTITAVTSQALLATGSSLDAGTAAPAPPGTAMSQPPPPLEQTTIDQASAVANVWETAGATSAAHKIVGWQQPVQATTIVPGRPP